MKISIQIFLLFGLIGLMTSCKKSTTESADVNEATTTTQASGTELSVDLTNSKVLWVGSKPTGKHNGFINLQSGTVVVNDGAVTGGKFVLDMNTITSTDLEGGMKDNLEAHLKGTAEGKEDDFFNVAKYPTATFEISKVTGLANDPDATHLVYGNLTLRDVTKEVGFKATIGTNDQGVRVSTQPFAINRADFGIKFMSKSFFDDLKDKFIDDNIDISINLTAA